MHYHSNIQSYIEAVATVVGVGMIIIIASIAFHDIFRSRDAKAEPILFENIAYTRKVLQVDNDGQVSYYVILETPILHSKNKYIETIKLAKEQYESYEDSGIIIVYLDENGCVTLI